MTTYNPDAWKSYQVDVPEGECGDWRIEKFSVTDAELFLFNLRLAFSPGHSHRQMVAGDYTRLMRKRKVVMSDTRAEIRDLENFILQLDGAKSVMIAGLGLGICLNAALLAPSVETVKVFEKSSHVFRLMEPHYRTIAARNNTLLKVFQNDIFDVKPCPDKSEHFDVVWFDIWDDICADNWRDMKRLKRRWSNHAEWMGCWCEDETRYEATGRYR